MSSSATSPRSTAAAWQACVVDAATAQDCAAIAQLARRVFRATFEAITPPHDMATFLEATYRPELFAADLENPQKAVFVARHSGQVIGFLQLREGPAPACIRGERPVELQRLYVDPNWHGAGAASALMARAMDEARQRNFATWWLGVGDTNFRAQRFYKKYGFVQRGSHIFPVGNDPQTDFLLEAPIVAPIVESAAPRLEK